MDLPIWEGGGKTGDQAKVEALVDDPDVAGHRRLPSASLATGGGIVLRLHAAGEQVDVGPVLGHVAVEGAAAGEHDVRPLECLTLAEDEVAGRVLERGRVVHDVVDDHVRIEGLVLAAKTRGVDVAGPRSSTNHTFRPRERKGVARRQ